MGQVKIISVDQSSGVLNSTQLLYRSYIKNGTRYFQSTLVSFMAKLSLISTYPIHCDGSEHATYFPTFPRYSCAVRVSLVGLQDMNFVQYASRDMAVECIISKDKVTPEPLKTWAIVPRRAYEGNCKNFMVHISIFLGQWCQCFWRFSWNWTHENFLFLFCSGIAFMSFSTMVTLVYLLLFRNPGQRVGNSSQCPIGAS